MSIVIPCRNEEAFISQCISSLLKSDHPSELIEIIVCDGMSDDRTPEILEDFATKHVNVIKLENKNQTTQHALNLGVKHATGEIIIILGAHAEVYPDFISKSVEVLHEHPDAGCVGGIVDNLTTSGSSKAIAIAMASPFGVGNAHFRTGLKEGYVDTVGSPAYKREVFETVGLFDDELVRNQDDEFNFRVLKAGYKIYFSKAIKYKYHVRPTFGKLLRQYFQYGYWKVYVNKKHKTITTGRQLVPALFVIYFIGGLLLSWQNLQILNLYLVVLGIYVISAFISAAMATLNPINIMKTMCAFIFMHFGYGVGYLEGLFHFYVLNKKPTSTHTTLTR